MSAGGDFWARRKASVAAETEDDLRHEMQVEHALAEEALAEKTDAEILDELQLPDPDDLQAGDDFSVFLAKAVPERLRRRALRRLWLSNPVLANVDDLVDYGEDFTDAAMVVEGLKTAYQVGKGMTQHIEEMARQAQETEEADALPNADAPEETSAAREAETFEGEGAAEAEVAPMAAETDAQAGARADTRTDARSTHIDHAENRPEDAPVLRRRMRFEFAAEAPAHTPILQETRPT